uniref:Putative ovule protein n=1 Tax=Solanum chacoense TaxID=4108 RepID=A0A0V0HKS0_SOLCH
MVVMQAILVFIWCRATFSKQAAVITQEPPALPQKRLDIFVIHKSRGYSKPFDSRLRPVLRTLNSDRWFDTVAVSAEE